MEAEAVMAAFALIVLLLGGIVPQLVSELPSGNQTWQWKISKLNGGFNRNITCTGPFSIFFHCHVGLQEGILGSENMKQEFRGV